jgi:membrane-associated phospholipid phosphatase
MAKKPFSPRYLIQESHRFLNHFYRTYKEYVLFVAGLLLGLGVVALMGKVFWELLDSLRAEKLGSFDDGITAGVLSRQGPVLDWYFSTITHLGGRFAYIALSVVLFGYLYFRKGNLVFAVEVVVVLIVAGALNVWLKDLIGRPRPEGAHLLGATNLSFPSGHAMSSIAFYGFLIHLCWRIYKSRLKKMLLSLLLLILILSIGLSRIYLQVHYPSDVLAGYAAGGSCLIIFILIFSVMRFRQRRRGEDIQPEQATAEDV